MNEFENPAEQEPVRTAFGRHYSECTGRVVMQRGAFNLAIETTRTALYDKTALSRRVTMCRGPTQITLVEQSQRVKLCANATRFLSCILTSLNAYIYQGETLHANTDDQT